MYACATCRYTSTSKSKVMLMLSPSAMSCSTPSIPAGVPAPPPPALQLAGCDQAATDVVQPDALPGVAQLVNRVRHDVALLSTSRSTSAAARSAICSGVKPNCSTRTLAGAEAPQRERA